VRYFNFIFSTVLIFGQAPAAPAEFEVASIKPSAAAEQGQPSAGFHFDGAMVRSNRLSLIDYLVTAYGVKNYQISAPEWMASERFDVTAKLPAGFEPKQLPEMLQALLRDRFQMKIHRETKEFPVYGLIVGKGELKLSESPVEAKAENTDKGEPPKGGVSVAPGGRGGGTTVTYGNGAYFTVGDNKFEGKKLPMLIIADVLARFADKPIVDMTGLKGNYGFTMEFSPEDFRAMMIRAAIAGGAVVPPEAMKLLDNSSGDSLFDAIQKLGLKLESRKAPIEMLVVDQAQKTPTDP
jgi:uncharacterized protein (TIGR03435 family)